MRTILNGFIEEGVGGKLGCVKIDVTKHATMLLFFIKRDVFLLTKLVRPAVPDGDVYHPRH